MSLTDIAKTEDDEIEALAATTIYVCITCRRAASDPDDAPRPGLLLARATKRAAQGTPQLNVQRVRCLGNCKRRLSAAMIRPGAWSYVFGDLSVDSGADLVVGAKLFAASADGLIPWRGRPDSLKRGLVPASLP